MKTFTQRIVESSADYLTEEFRKQLIGMLTNAFKEEINAFYAYFIVKEYLVGINRKCVEEFFEEAAKDELYDHAAYILKRIAQLGGYPVDANHIANVAAAKHPYIAPIYTQKNLNPQDDMSDKIEYAVDVKTAINQNIEAEKGAIETYRQICDYTQNIDIVTHREIKRILEDEVEHLQELLDLKADIESMEKQSGCCGSCCSPVPAGIPEPICPCEEPCSQCKEPADDNYDLSPDNISLDLLGEL